MNKRFDYDALERQYVQGDMSLRELAASAGITNHSLIMRQSKKREWPEKRKKFREQANETALTVMAGQTGRRIAREEQVRDNAIGALDDMITRLREDLRKTKTVLKDGVYEEVPLVRVGPNDIVNIIDRMQILFGKPSQITEDRSFGVHIESADTDLLRQVVEATRGVGLDSGPTAESPLPLAPAARKD